jgi:nitrile hydratase
VTSDNQNHGGGHSPDEAATHRHPKRPDLEDTITYYRAMEIAPSRAVGREGRFHGGRHPQAGGGHGQPQPSARDRSPAQGARVVAKAWIDLKYRSLLLSDGGEACVVAGLDRGPYKLVVVETPATRTT